MLVGVPKEIKDNEYRVGLIPSTAHELTANGHRVLVEMNAGLGAGLPDSDYKAAGAEIARDSDEVYGRAEMIVKVKEPLAAERKKLKSGQILFTYLHLAPDRQQTEDLLAAGVIGIAYETVTSPQAAHRLLEPRSGRGALRARRSADRHRACPWRRGAEADFRADRESHETRCGHHRRGHRPGRLFGDSAPDHAFESDLSGR